MNASWLGWGARRPLTVYAISALLALVFGSLIPGIQVDTDPENMLATDQPDRVYHNTVKRDFGLHDAIVVGMVGTDDPNGIYNSASLSDLHRLTEQILEIDGVIRPDLMSLATVDNIEQAGPGTVRFSWMMDRPPADDAAAQAVRNRVERLPMLTDTLVSGDGQAAAIYVPIERKDESHRIAEEIRQHIAELDSEDAFHITGLPVAEDTFGYEMFVQMGISAPTAAAVIFLLMWVFFGNLRLVISPMVVAMLTVIVTMGALIGMGFTVHIMSSMIPIFLMPIAVVDSIHILSEFADHYRPGSDRKAVISGVVGKLFRPMLFTSVTSAVGFLSLALTPIPPVQVFGVFIALGILLAFVLTVVFIPAYVARMSDRALDSLQRVHHGGEDEGLLARSVRAMGRAPATRPKLLLAGLAVIAAVSVVGVGRIEINDNPVRWFKADHPIRVADEVLNHHFAGTYDAYYVLEFAGGMAPASLADEIERGVGAAPGDAAAILTEAAGLLRTGDDAAFSQALARLDDGLWSVDSSSAPALEAAMARVEQAQEANQYFLEPEALELIERLQAALGESGKVGKTNALPDLVRTVNRELRGGEAVDYRLPGQRAGVAQALLQFQSSHRPQDLWRMVTPDYRRAVIWLQLESGDNQDMSAVIAALDAALAAEPLPDEVNGRWAGKTFINVIWQDAMVKGMLSSLLGAFVVVLIMMVVLFRSLVFGIVAMLPLSITILAIYGLIGWIGKDYDMPIAVLSALTLGLSVDFAIHFLERSRAVHAESGRFLETMAAMFEEPGRAITRNALVIAIGFTPLLLAPLVPYVTVGFFLAAIMAVSAVVTLFMLPAVGAVLRRWMYPKPADPSSLAPQVSS